MAIRIDYQQLANRIAAHPDFDKLGLISNFHDLTTRAISHPHNGEKTVARNDLRLLANTLGIETVEE